MEMTAEGLALIKRFEGFRGTAYRCPAGVWTIGYGHTSAAGEPAVAGGMQVARAEANEILARDVEAVARQVRAAVTAPLTDCQFSALVSFTFNVGIGNFRGSSVLKAVNAGGLEAVPRRLQLWTKASGKVLPGLVRRRAAEAELFLGDDDSVQAGEIEAVTGKSLKHSTTGLAAVISALAGIASTLLASARAAIDTFGGPLMGLALMAVMVAAALWIVRERRRKSLEDGV